MHRLRQLFGVAVPIVQAPMANAQDHALAVAVAEAGALGSIPCGALTADQVRAEVAAFRARVTAPLNLNFFCHVLVDDAAALARWRERLAPYYTELGISGPPPAIPLRAPFDDAMCRVVEDLRPTVASFHYGLPAPALLDRVKAAGVKIMSSATTVAEARWLAERGCDAIIAQGAEAGGHRGMFLDDDVGGQVGTMALVPQIVDAVSLPVIASGGIADGRGLAAALVLGAAGAQIGTAYLRAPEAKITAFHRAALAAARDDSTRITNVLTGRPARGLATRFIREVGPLAADVPVFPGAATGVAPLRAAAEARGSSDFSTMLAGQAAPMARELGARELTTLWIEDARRIFRAYATSGSK